MSAARVRYILDVDHDTITIHDLWNRNKSCYVENINNYVMLDFTDEAKLKFWVKKNIKHVHMCKHCLSDVAFADQKHYKEQLVRYNR